MQATIRNIAALWAAAFCASAAHAGFFSNPLPVVSTPPGETVLRMELNGYANYGQVDAAADVAYRGDSHTWVFTLPIALQSSDLSGAYFRAALALDDIYSVDPLLYSFNIATGGAAVFAGAAQMAHGGPFNSVFTNWTVRDYAMAGVAGSPWSFSLSNTSATAASNWIAVDWIELRVPTAAVPEPASAWLLALGAAGLGLHLTARRRNNASPQLKNT
jgi:PEP-CTERM motif